MPTLGEESAKTAAADGQHHVVEGGSPRATDGEEAIYHQYRAAFASARRTIYLASQHPGERRLLELLDAALARGVSVTLLVPGEPLGAIRRARATAERYWREPAAERPPRPPRYAETFARLDALAQHPRFTLAALAVNDGAGGYREVYVHAKLCLIDDAWGTIGSANLVDISLLADHTELNLSFWHGASAARLLRALVAEHAGLDPATLGAWSDREVIEKFQETARANARRRSAGAPLRGHCYALEPTRYGA